MGNIFGGSSSGGYEDAAKIYQEYLDKGMSAFKEHEAQGRGDIEGYLGKGLEYEAPYREAGKEALSDYQATLGEGGGMAGQDIIDKFRAGPGYKYALQQGLQSTRRASAASGRTGSGAEMKELQRTGQGIADQEYGRYQAHLAGLAGMGQQSAARAGAMTSGAGTTLANLGFGYGKGEAGLYGQMGEAQANALMAQKLAEMKNKGQMWNAVGQGAGALAKFAFN